MRTAELSVPHGNIPVIETVFGITGNLEAVMILALIEALCVPRNEN